ncbi:hypothetical protein FKM82_024531 [Ascaphus truei]
MAVLVQNIPPRGRMEAHRTLPHSSVSKRPHLTREPSCVYNSLFQDSQGRVRLADGSACSNCKRQPESSYTSYLEMGPHEDDSSYIIRHAVTLGLLGRLSMSLSPHTVGMTGCPAGTTPLLSFPGAASVLTLFYSRD